MNNGPEKVSVVLTTHNSDKYIQRAIQSVIEQTFASWELIVVDDASTDETPVIVAKIAQQHEKVRMLRKMVCSGGPANGRNLGVSEARHDWVAFLDADDVWHPHKLELQLGELLHSPTALLCTAMRDFHSENDMLFRRPKGRNTQLVTFEMQRRRARIPTSSVLASREVLLKHPFDERPLYRAVEDYDCWLRILSTGVICTKVRHELVYYRKTESQLSKSKGGMLGKVFMVHRASTGGNVASALLYTLTHALGGTVRHLTKRM